jgi:hypothetical protein
MRIDRSQIDEAFLDSVYLLNGRNEKYLTRQNYIFLTRGGTKNPLGWSVVFFWIAQLSLPILFFSMVIRHDWHEYILLTTEGKTSLAILVEKEVFKDCMNTKIYRLHYLYQVDNETYPLEIGVEPNEFESAESSRSIIYAASDRSIATFEIEHNLQRFLMSRNILIGIVVSYLLVVAYRIFRKVRLIPAQIVSTRPYSHRILFWERHLLELQYEFLSPKTGQTISTIRRVPADNPPLVGQSLALIYDNDNKFFIL